MKGPFLAALSRKQDATDRVGNHARLNDVVAALFRDQFQAVKQYMAHRLGWSEADGAAQDVFLKVWLALRTLPSGKYNPPALLWKIAPRVATNRRARLARHLAVTVALEEGLEAPEGSSDPVVVQKVEALLFQLPPLDRKLLIMRFVEHESAAAIANLLGMSPPAVRQRLSRTLGWLRAEMTAS